MKITQDCLDADYTPAGHWTLAGGWGVWMLSVEWTGWCVLRLMLVRPKVHEQACRTVWRDVTKDTNRLTVYKLSYTTLISAPHGPPQTLPRPAVSWPCIMKPDERQMQTKGVKERD